MKVRAGKSVSRQDIEDAIAVRANSEGLSYRVTWSVRDKQAATLAVKGETFAAPLLSGGTYDFSTVLGRKPGVLTFWASWCAPCIDEAPHLQRLFGVYADKGVAFVAVSIDEESDHDKLRGIVAGKKLAYPVPLDPRGEVLANYANGASIPLTFVVSRSGEVVYKHQNFEAGDEVELEAAIKRELSNTKGASAP